LAHIPRIPPRIPDDDRHGRNRPGRRPDPWNRSGPPRDSPQGFRSPAPEGPQGEPAITLPGAVLAMIGLMAAVQLARAALGTYQDMEVLAWFAFIPARYTNTFMELPGGLPAQVWTFVTYGLLHGSWVHLLTNAVWTVAFGAAVARRFGALRFWVFSAAAAAGGAALHLVFHIGDPIPVVGASAAISGQMAAAARFVFDSGGPLRLRSPHGGDAAFKRPANTLVQTFQNRTALAFILLWFAINLAVGLASSATGGLSIAWQAHVGGFLVGLLTFRLFDPVPR